MNKYIRLSQTSVTKFIYHKDKWLFLKRGSNKRVDPGKLNGIGRRLEEGENYLEACIRETEEETGYIVKPKDISLAGIVKLSEEYKEDWIMCFLE